MAWFTPRPVLGTVACGNGKLAQLKTSVQILRQVFKKSSESGLKGVVVLGQALLTYMEI